MLISLTISRVKYPHCSRVLSNDRTIVDTYGVYLPKLNSIGVLLFSLSRHFNCRRL